MKVQFVYWQEKDVNFLSYLQDCPDHWTQGTSLEDIKQHLMDLYHGFSKNDLPGIR